MLKEMQFEIISMIYMLTLTIGAALLIVSRFCFQKQCYLFSLLAKMCLTLKVNNAIF